VVVHRDDPEVRLRGGTVSLRSAPMGPRSVESIFLKKRVRARLRATPLTRRAASTGLRARLSVSTTLTGARSPSLDLDAAT